MKMIKYLSLILLACLFLTTSCDGFLNRTPLDSPSDQNFPSNAQEMKMALAGCYAPLYYRFINMPFFISFDYMSDIAFDRNAGVNAFIRARDLSASNSLVTGVWTNFYQGISRCNYLISNLDRVSDASDAEKNQTEGETRFLRAIYYMYLTELYGDVPLVKENLTIENAQVARTTKSEVVDFMLEDLAFAEQHLATANKHESGHASYSSAMALKARIALYNERWQVAADAAQAVMNLEGSEVILNTNLVDLFNYNGNKSKEILFAVQYHSNDENLRCPFYRLFGTRTAGNLPSSSIPSQQLVDAFECIDGMPITTSPLFDPALPYANRDPRLTKTLAVSGSGLGEISIFFNHEFETHGDSTECSSYDDAGNVIGRITNMDGRGGDPNHAAAQWATFSGVCWRKYAEMTDKPHPFYTNLDPIMLRYAEVLLTYAEAQVQLNNLPEARVALNKVRARAGMPDVTETDKTKLLHKVYNERKVELAGEGLRYFDIRRWKIAEDVMNQNLLGRIRFGYPTREQLPVINDLGDPTYRAEDIAPVGESYPRTQYRLVEERNFAAHNYLWPIPDIERQTNPNLTQNTGY